MNRTYKAYIMTRDGYRHLALLYHGKEAAKFRERFTRELPRDSQTARHL